MLRLAASGGGGVVVSAGTKSEMDARISHTIVSASESMKRMATAPLRCTHLPPGKRASDGGGAGHECTPAPFLPSPLETVTHTREPAGRTPASPPTHFFASLRSVMGKEKLVVTDAPSRDALTDLKSIHSTVANLAGHGGEGSRRASRCTNAHLRRTSTCLGKSLHTRPSAPTLPTAPVHVLAGR